MVIPKKETAGIILSTAFVIPKAQAYADYVNYMDRSEAVRNEFFESYNAFSKQNHGEARNTAKGAGETMFSQYGDYMANPKKTSALFTHIYDQAPSEVIRYIKDYFEEAQLNGSPLWQHVFSFKNEWLVEHGILSETTGELNQTRLYAATRKAMDTLEKKEGLQGEWIGAIHYNTDNIHVHVGYAEALSTRPWIEVKNEKTGDTHRERKGKFLQKSIKATRGQFVNELLELDILLAKTSKQFEEILQQAKDHREIFLSAAYDQLFQELYAAMPSSRNRWRYGYAKGQRFQKEVDAITNFFLNTEQAREVEELKEALKPVSDEYGSAYGNPRNKPTYAENKLYGKDGLYHKIGNVILKRLLEYDKENRQRKLGASLGKIDLEACQQENQAIPSNLPARFRFLKTGPEEFARIPERSIDDRYYDSLENQVPEAYPEGPYAGEVPEDLYMRRMQEETYAVDPQMDEALKKMQAYFKTRASSYEERIAKALAELEKERIEALARNRSVKHLEKSDEEILLKESPAETPSFKPFKRHLPEETAERGSSEKKSGEGLSERYDLDRFSIKNQKRILENFPEATMVFGPNQWRLNGRQVCKDQLECPIILTGAETQEGHLRFYEFAAYDISQTEALPAAEYAEILRQAEEYSSINRYSYRRSSKHDHQLSLQQALKKDVRSLRKLMRRSTQDHLDQRTYRKLQYDMEH